MIQTTKKEKAGFGLYACWLLIVLSACDQTSSPEGRMSLKLENLQRQVMDSMKQQNAALLETVSAASVKT